MTYGARSSRCLYICCWCMYMLPMVLWYKRLICLLYLRIVAPPICGERMLTLMTWGQGDQLLIEFNCIILCFCYSFLVILGRIAYLVTCWWYYRDWCYIFLSYIAPCWRGCSCCCHYDMYVAYYRCLYGAWWLSMNIMVFLQRILHCWDYYLWL